MNLENVSRIIGELSQETDAPEGHIIYALSETCFNEDDIDELLLLMLKKDEEWEEDY